MIILSETHPPPDGVRHMQPDTGAFMGENNLGIGKLYVSESLLTWICNDGRGFSLSYPAISMHAISRDARSFPQPCIFMVVDDIGEKKNGSEANVHEKMAACSLKTELNPPAIVVSTAAAEAQGQNGSSTASNGNDSDNEDEGETKIMEMRFVPADANCLEGVYHALSDCQALHPDENESISGGSSDNEPYELGVDDADGEVQFDNGGQLILSQMRGVRQDDDEYMEDIPRRVQESEDMETGQFDDATE